MFYFAYNVIFHVCFGYNILMTNLDNRRTAVAHQTMDGPLDSLGPGPRLNIKTVLSTYGDFHVKDKTAVRTSYL